MKLGRRFSARERGACGWKVATTERGGRGRGFQSGCELVGSDSWRERGEMQGRGRGRDNLRGYTHGWGNGAGALMPAAGLGGGIGSGGGWFQGYAAAPVAGSGMIGGWRQVGYPGPVEVEFGAQPPSGPVGRGGQISGPMSAIGGQKSGTIREDCHARVGPGHPGGGIGALGRVGPGAAVYPDRRTRTGGRGAGGVRGGMPATGQYGPGKGPGGGNQPRAGGRTRGDVNKSTGSSTGVAAGGVGGARGSEDKKQVCQFFLRTGTCAFGNRCAPRDCSFEATP